METIDKYVDINICDNRPFIYKPKGEERQWQDFKSLLFKKLRNKRLDVSMDGYITEIDGSTCLNSFMREEKESVASETYISHVILKNGKVVDNELDRKLPLPKIVEGAKVRNYRMKRLIAGHRNSGTALHSHSRAYFMNIGGNKKWFLAQPTKRNDEILEKYKYDIKNKRIGSISKWFSELSEYLAKELDGGEIIILQSNESLYIPDGYYHAVVNLETTIGVAFSWEKRAQCV